MRLFSHTVIAMLACTILVGPAQAGEDIGKKACVVEARRLCPAEMRSMSRKRVESCMIVKIDQTSSTCHGAMLRIKAERQAKKK